MELGPVAIPSAISDANRAARMLKPGEPLCMAPTISIFFRHDGKVMACCRNHTQLYGRYPENSLEEIWAGVSRRALQKDIDRDVFPSGCADCLDNVMSGNHRGVLASRFDEFRLGPKQPTRIANTLAVAPLAIEFELGTICNFECVMCSGSCSSSIRKNRDKLPPRISPYDDSFVDQLRPFIPALKQASFLGGEPLLNRLNFKVWDLLLEMKSKAEISITTNGSILTDKVKRTLLALRPRLSVSLESLVPGSYEAIRVNGKIEELRENLTWLHENDLLDSISVCPIRMNWQDIPGVVEYCNQIEVPVWFNTVVEPAHLSLKFMRTQELDEVVRYLETAKIASGPRMRRRGGYTLAQINGWRFRDLVNLVKAWRDASSGKPMNGLTTS